MEKTFYPPLEDNVFWAMSVIREHVLVDPDYLDSDECTYPEEFKDIFRKAGAGGGEEDVVHSDDLSDIDLVAETTSLFKNLKEASENFSATDHSERMSYFRTSTSLLEKLIAMQERAHNVRQVSRFYATVLSVMEETLEPDQITQVRARIMEHTA